MVQRPWFCKLIPFQIAKNTNIFKGKLFCNVHFIVFEIIAKKMTTILCLGFYKKPKGLKKPYNPILGETFRCYWHHPSGSKTFYISEQVRSCLKTLVASEGWDGRSFLLGTHPQKVFKIFPDPMRSFTVMEKYDS